MALVIVRIVMMNIFAFNVFLDVECLGLALSCIDKEFTLTNNLFDIAYYMFIEIYNSVLMPFNGLFETILLSLVQNEISEFFDVFKPGDYDSLKLLSLAFNKLTTLRYASKNVTFMNLIFLNLSNNIINEIENFAFTKFVSLQILDLSSNQLFAIISNKLIGISKLKVLCLSGNILLKSKIEASHIPHLRLIFSDSSQVCCIAKSLKIFCTLLKQVSSPCSTLLKILVCEVICMAIWSIFHWTECNVNARIL